MSNCVPYCASNTPKCPKNANLEFWNIACYLLDKNTKTCGTNISFGKLDT